MRLFLNLLCVFVIAVLTIPLAYLVGAGIGWIYVQVTGDVRNWIVAIPAMLAAWLGLMFGAARLTDRIIENRKKGRGFPID